MMSTDNVFRSYRVAAKPHLQAGRNQIEVVIQPASEAHMLVCMHYLRLHLHLRPDAAAEAYRERELSVAIVSPS